MKIIAVICHLGTVSVESLIDYPWTPTHDEHTCGKSRRNSNRTGGLNLQRLLEFGEVPWPAMCQVGNVFEANATDFGIV